MSLIPPNIRRVASNGLVAVTIPWADADPEEMEWFTLTLDALDDAGATALFTNDPSRGVVALARTSDASDRFLGHLATALGVDLAPTAHMAERATLTIADDLTTDDDLDALQTIYSIAHGDGLEMQIVIDLDEECVTFTLPTVDATTFVAHLTA